MKKCYSFQKPSLDAWNGPTKACWNDAAWKCWDFSKSSENRLFPISFRSIAVSMTSKGCVAAEWGLFIKMATGCESQRWGTLAEPGSRRWVDRLCRQHERRVLVLSNDFFSLSKSASDPWMWTPNVLPSFLVGDVARKTGRNHWGLSFFRAWHVAINHRSWISIAGPSIVLVHALWTPKTFLLLYQPFYISQVPFFLFFSPIVALHKHWKMLDHLTASSACFGEGRNSAFAARFRSRRSCTCWLWTSSQRTIVWF